MKNIEITEFLAALSSPEISSLKGAKFAFAVSKNKGKINPIVESLKEVQLKIFDEINEFEKERVLLCIEYSDKDENGKPKIFSDPSRGSQYEIVSRREEFDKEIKTLKDKHKGSIESKEKLDAEFNKLLDQDEYIDIHKVDLSDVPKDISVQALNGILPMISEE